MSTTRSTSSSASDATSRGASHVPGHPVPDGRTARRVPRWAVPPVAAVVAAVVLLVGTALGVDPAVRTATGTQTVGVVAAVVVTLVVGYAGWGVRALLGRLRSGGRRPWLVTCGVVLLVSLLGPLGAVTPGAVALLVVEHLTVGATLTLALRR
ncbi:DUF6069 family protein [Cellulosimicrobium funkei]|uniref:DUF6069 family protein n=1 Tax=Cellulosimicrobium funkei TaxID=264251 RepID=UPI000A61D721|nr:DUF6069 family protein [Cellulosimicrobium funkei]